VAAQRRRAYRPDEDVGEPLAARGSITMASNTAQQTAADTMADELAIRNLIARLAQFADMAPIDGLDDYIACFTDDASWEMGDIVNRGKEALLEAARERRRGGQQGPGTNSRHVITTIAVSVDGSDTATSDAYFLAFGDTTTAPNVKLMGHYHDTFRRTPDGWKLARRQITVG
jgi:3-phenylpropionate/cinnamic acid dioxygenase small subunit